MSRDNRMISEELFEKIIDVIPILCVDIVVKNKLGKYLLVKRANEPLKGQWWVIGGRVHKGETLEQAAYRKVKTESSLRIKALRVIGYYECTFSQHPLNVVDGIHAVSIVFSTVMESSQEIKLDSQSSAWKFSDCLPAEFVIKPIGRKYGE